MCGQYKREEELEVPAELLTNIERILRVVENREQG